MKTGKSLTELAQELERLKNDSRDFVVPTAKLSMEVAGENPTPVLRMQNGQAHDYRPTSWAHSQLAQVTDIPKAYYDRIAAENPTLLARNVNHGFDRLRAEAAAKGKPEARMIRTVGGQVRAVLSSKYRRLDCYDLAETVLPVMVQNRFEVVSSEITDRRMYLKALTPRVQGEIKPGDVVQFGLCISSSDVGAGSLRVEPLMYRLVCSNGLITNTAIRKFHVGKNQAGDDIQELLSDATKELSDAAFWAQVRDVVQGHMRSDIFELEMAKLRVAAGEKITNFDIEEVVELTMKRVGVTGEKTKHSMVGYLANGADGAGLNRYGLLNAMTYAAQQDHVDYDQSVELERAAYEILELPKKDWARIAEKAA